uniref:POU domain protein n=1 Tax=Scleropages formosus TaxID=113540 RepID=A0A8C9VII9_SCLFO
MARQGLGYTDWPYEVDSAPGYSQSQVFGHQQQQQQQLGQFPSAVLQEPSAFVHNAFVPPQQLRFPALGGDYRQPGPEVSEQQAYSGNWCQVIVPDYAGQVLGVNMTPQTPGRSPLVAKPVEQVTGQEMRSAHDFDAFASEQKIMQPQPSPGHLVGAPRLATCPALPRPRRPAAPCPPAPPSFPPRRRPLPPRNAEVARKKRRTAAKPRGPAQQPRRPRALGPRALATDLEAFAKLLKQKRVALGFTQADLGISLGKLCGRVFSQTTICRFEALQLSFGNMCALLPVLKRWLAEVEASDNPHEKLQGVVVNVAKRKNRTSLSDETRQSLENWYSVCPRPTAQQITQLSTSLELHRDVVRVWFCNRRQKGKRLDENSAEEKNQHLAFQYIQCHPQMPQYVEHDQQGLHMQGMTLPAQGFPGSGHPVLPAMYVPPSQSTEAYNQVLPHGLHHFRD